MKPLYYTLSLFFAIILYACQTEDTLKSGVGYLRLNINESNETQTKAASLPEGYTGKQIAVKIIDKSGKVVKKTDDWELWKDESIELSVGTYTIQASSYGFDGKQSAVEAPYYYGEETVSITSGKEANAKVVCKLANVKVSVKLSDNIKTKFKAFDITVKPQETGACDPITISVDLAGDSETKAIYFPVTNLTVQYTLTNQNNVPHLATYDLSEVKGNDHYILNFTLAEIGTIGDVTVTVDETMQEYEYTFTVSQYSKNNANLTVGAWDRLAYLKAENVTTGTGVSTEGITFQYRIKTSTQTRADETLWNDVATTVNENTYTAMLTGLTASTTYEYRLANAEGESLGSVKEFSTPIADSKESLYNGNFENWYQSGQIWYAASQADVSNQSYMWDSSNPGSGSFGFNPTTGSTDIKHGGNYSAKLETQHAVLRLAAASLYYGRFNSLVGTKGAKIDFGQSFTSRPIALKGYFQYAPKAIDYVGSNQPANTVSKGATDMCSIFIILSKGTYQVDNTDTSTLLTEEKVKNTNQFIAYGELPASECISTNGQWKEFNIPLKYKEEAFGEKPTHLIIVCTSSKYGDYFTGGKESTMYLDDFELIYEGEPTIWK